MRPSNHYLIYSLLLTILLLTSTIKTKEGMYGFPEENDVVVLDQTNFDDFIKEHHFSLIKFCVDWSKGCKDMAQNFSLAAKELKNREHPFPLAQVDATKNIELVERYHFHQYPTLKFFINGEPIHYHHQYKVEDIVKWCDKKNSPPVVEITTEQELRAEIEDHDAVVGYFGDSEAELQVFKWTGRNIEDIHFIHSNSPELKKKYAKVTMFREFDEDHAEFEEEVTRESLHKFIWQNRYPLIMEFDNQAAIDRIFVQKTPALIYFSDEVTDLVYTLQKVAEDYKDKISVFTSTITRGLGKRLAHYVGLGDNDEDTLWLIHPDEDSDEIHKYRFHEQSINQKTIEEFIEKFEEEELHRHFKSQLAPEEQTHPVRTVVGANWHEEVMDEHRHVLLYVSTAWCHHCKKADPIFENLAENYSYMDKVLRFAKIDAELNDIAGFSIKEYPTVVLYQMHNKLEPLTYNGDLTNYELLRDWLSANVAHDWFEQDTDL